MKPQHKNRIKALFLLLVFSLNTVAGFACSVGVDMGYNTKHHEPASINEASSHEHSAVHKHNHEHSEELVGRQIIKSNSDDCCSNEVTKFMQLDKSVAQNHLLLQAPNFLLAFTSTFLLASQNENSFAVNSKFQFVRRSCSLNHTSIRIAIQSFQI